MLVWYIVYYCGCFRLGTHSNRASSFIYYFIRGDVTYEKLYRYRPICLWQTVVRTQP